VEDERDHLLEWEDRAPALNTSQAFSAQSINEHV